MRQIERGSTGALRRRRSLVAVAAASAVAITIAVPGVSFALGATGDSKTIAYYRVAVSKTNNLVATETSQTGYVRIYSSVGKVNVSRWVWGSYQFRPGYYASREKIKFVQRAGKVFSVDDTLTPIVPKCHATACNAVYPIEFYVTKGKAYEGIITKGQHASCFYKEPTRNVPYGTGYPVWGTYGYFYPMVIAGGVARVTSKFTIASQPVTEIDTINRTTKIFTASTFHYGAGGGSRAYSYKATYTVLKTPPKAPVVKFC